LFSRKFQPYEHRQFLRRRVVRDPPLCRRRHYSFSLLSSCPSIDTANDTEILISKKKNSGKRESTDISSLASSVKKPSSASLADLKSNRIESVSDANRANQQPVSLPPLSATSASISPVHRYNSKDLPPFIAQVQSIQESAFSHPLHISRTLSNILPRGILEIRKSGRGKVLVQTNTYEVTNRLVDNKSLSAHNLKAFIPSYRILRCGIVRDIPQDFSADIIKEFISSPIKILDLHRLNHRVKWVTIYVCRFPYFMC